MAQIHELTMTELAAAIRAGELSPVAVTDHYLRRTAELNDQVGAFYTITPEFAADQAREAEKAVAAADDPADLPPLTGVPIPIKDLNMVAGVRQTLGSKAFEAMYLWPSGSARDLSIASRSLSTIGAGVPAFTQAPYQKVNS